MNRAEFSRPIQLGCLSGYVLALLLSGIPAAGQSQNEHAVRAAYVFNLAKYIEWPQQNSTLTIGFVGDGPMGETLVQMLAGKTTESHPIQVYLYPSDEILDKCDILYIGGSSSKKVREALDRIANRSILTVGETSSFAHDGGMIGLVRIGEQLQIQINLAATQNAHLKVSSRLLNLQSVIRIAEKN